MPGKKYRSLNLPSAYEGMRKHGFSKAKAAAISNWMAKKGYGKAKKGRKK